jgi:hypothetical protein
MRLGMTGLKNLYNKGGFIPEEFNLKRNPIHFPRIIGMLEYVEVGIVLPIFPNNHSYKLNT